MTDDTLPENTPPSFAELAVCLPIAWIVIYQFSDTYIMSTWAPNNRNTHRRRWEELP